MSNRNHLTWSVETHDGKCPECNVETVLVNAPSYWMPDNHGRDSGDDVEVVDEVTGHYCPKCKRLRSLSLNTLES